MTDHHSWPARVRTYVLTVSALGLVVLGLSAYDLILGRIDLRWLGLACLTILSASLTIKIPAVPARISVSETFVFTSLLVFGVSAAALTVAIDGLVASLWAFRGRPHAHLKTLFNTTAPAASFWLAAALCFGIAGIEPMIHVPVPVESILAPLFILATVYFVFNSWLTAAAIGLETGVSPTRIWSDNFLWMAINYFGGASVSVLLVLLFHTPAGGSPMLGIVVPLLTIFYLTLKFVTGRSEDTIAHLTALKSAAEERARLEEQLRDAHKMESVGRLAAGVAHDFNNLLAPILGYAEMLLDELPPESRHRDEMVQIRQAAERARDLTRQLLAFGRKQLLSLTVVDLRLIVTGFEKLLRRTLREDIQIELELPDTAGFVSADTGQVEQVLMNLAVNAQDAMPHGGRLVFSLAETTVNPSDTKAATGLMPGAYVALTVRDSGIGMDAETLALVGEPFFTTKERREGTGLGLSTVFGIVKQHGGHLTIDSAPGRGTSVTVFFPQTDQRLLDIPADEPAAGT